MVVYSSRHKYYPKYIVLSVPDSNVTIPVVGMLKHIDDIIDALIRLKITERTDDGVPITPDQQPILDNVPF